MKMVLRGSGRVVRAMSLLVLMPLALLTGCLQSETLLLTEADFVQPLPDEFTMFGYSSKDGVYKLNVQDDGKPRVTQFTRAGAGYQPVGEKGTLYFAPNGEGSYLAATSGEDGTVFYGFAEIRGQFMLSQFLSLEPQKDLDRLRENADPEARALLDEVSFKDGSFQIESREALLLLAERVRTGELVLQGGPLYWLPGLVDGADPATAPPAQLDAQGNVIEGG